MRDKTEVDDSDKPFDGILGNSSEVKIIEHLLASPNFEFTIKDLMEDVGVSRPSATDVIKRLMKWRMVDQTREVGNSKFYRLNQNSGLNIFLTDFSDELLRLIIKEDELESNPAIANYPLVMPNYKIARQFENKGYPKVVLVGAGT